MKRTEINEEQKKRRIEIIKYYIANQPITQAEVGKHYGITRQAVSLILLRHNVHAIKVRKPKHSQCAKCGRKFGKLLHAGKGLCSACYQMKEPKRIRTILYPTQCSVCGKAIPRGVKRAKGKCGNCYARNLYKKYHLTNKKT